MYVKIGLAGGSNCVGKQYKHLILVISKSLVYAKAHFCPFTYLSKN